MFQRGVLKDKYKGRRCGFEGIYEFVYIDKNNIQECPYPIDEMNPYHNIHPYRSAHLRHRPVIAPNQNYGFSKYQNCSMLLLLFLLLLRKLLRRGIPIDYSPTVDPPPLPKYFLPPQCPRKCSNLLAYSCHLGLRGVSPGVVNKVHWRGYLKGEGVAYESGGILRERREGGCA